MEATFHRGRVCCLEEGAFDGDIEGGGVVAGVGVCLRAPLVRFSRAQGNKAFGGVAGKPTRVKPFCSALICVLSHVPLGRFQACV